MSLEPEKARKPHIRLLSIQKILRDPTLNLIEPRLQLIWLCKNGNDLRNFERAVKKELKDKINLVKCQKIQALKTLHPTLNENPCIVLLQQSYKPFVLDFFTTQKVQFIVYSSDIVQKALDFRKSKVFFMTEKEQLLINYIKKVATNIKMNRPSQIKMDQVKEEKAAIKNLIQAKNGEGGEGSPKRGSQKLPPVITKRWKNQLTNVAFLNSKYKYPGPGTYNV